MSKRWHFFALGNVILLLHILFSFTYYDRWYQSGTLPTDGDSISIPIGMNALMTLCFLPVLNGFLWYATKGYVQKPLFQYSFRTPRDWIINVIVFVSFLLVLVMLYGDITDRIPAYEWILLNFLRIYLLLNLGARSRE